MHGGKAESAYRVGVRLGGAEGLSLRGPGRSELHDEFNIVWERSIIEHDQL